MQFEVAFWRVDPFDASFDCMDSWTSPDVMTEDSAMEMFWDKNPGKHSVQFTRKVEN